LKLAAKTDMSERSATARQALDAWVREVVAWHFDPATGSPFWLERAKTLSFDPRRDVKGYDDLGKFGPFQDEWLRGGPVRKWVPKGFAGQPVYVFETGGSTGVPKARVNVNDFRLDYEAFSHTLPDEFFPRKRGKGEKAGSNGSLHVTEDIHDVARPPDRQPMPAKRERCDTQINIGGEAPIELGLGSACCRAP